MFVAFVLGASIAGIVSADEASDRDALIREIDALLGSAASELQYAGSGSSSYVDSARSKVQQVSSTLSSLDRVKGNDAKAYNYVTRYPRYVEDFERATRPLLQLKNNQLSLADLPRRCSDLDKQLVEQAQRFERDKDGERIEELRRLALDTGSKAEEWWRDAERKRDEMSRWADDARRFSVSEDQWSYVTSALQGASNRALEMWMKDLSEVDQACKDLRQRDRHPVVERVLRELSSTAQGKDAIYVQLDDRLKRAESAIRDLETDSSSAKVNDARSAISDIERFVRDLDAVKGTDKKATHIASQWPDYIRNFVAPATALVGLKETQYQLDAAPARCDASSQQLATALKAFLDSNDPDGLTEGPKLGEELGEKYTKAVSTMESARSTLKGLVATAGNFDARDDRWSPLRRQIKETAERMYDYWDKKTQEVHSKCDDLAKGVRNPVVESFMRDLGGKTQSDLKDFQDLVQSWERDAREIYTLDCKGMQELWDAWCAVELEPHEEPEISIVEQKTAEVIDRSSAKIDGVLGRLGPLRDTARRLGAKAKYRDAVYSLTAEMDKQQARLDKLKRKNGDWRGNNNPAVQFTKTFGQQAHDRMASQYSCNIYDQPGYPGLGKGRPDCVVVRGRDDCWVYEFKPRDWNGRDPLPEYTEAITKYYTRNMRKDETPASNLGGASFQALVEANCREDRSKDRKEDTIRFESAFRYYDRCSYRYECPE